MRKMASVPKGARTFSKVVADFGLEIASGVMTWTMMSVMVLHWIPSTRADVSNELADHSACLLDLIKGALELNVPQVRI